jgi:hypothetical protein
MDRCTKLEDLGFEWLPELVIGVRFWILRARKQGRSTDLKSEPPQFWEEGCTRTRRRQLMHKQSTLVALPRSLSLLDRRQSSC